MRSGGGKAKGASFERAVCKSLSLWLTNNESSDVLWRSAMSGGRATLQLKEGIINKAQAGDISPIAPEGFLFVDTFVIECKHYKSLDIESGLFKNTGKLYSFWDKLKGDAFKIQKRPMLIAKQNLFPTLLILSTRKTLNNQYIPAIAPLLVNYVWRAEFFLFDDFLKSTNPIK